MTDLVLPTHPYLMDIISNGLVCARSFYVQFGLMTTSFSMSCNLFPTPLYHRLTAIQHNAHHTQSNMRANLHQGLNAGSFQRIWGVRSGQRCAVHPGSVRANAVSVQAGSRVTEDDLVAYIASGCKPKAKWRIGTEHEKLVVTAGDKTRADYTKIEALLKSLISRFGWEPLTEEGNVIGAKIDGQSVTLEPGGQLELSGAPVQNLHLTCAEVNSHLYQVKAIAQALDVEFIGIGFDPESKHEDAPLMPKGRYKLMRSYMPTVGTLGLDMMFRSCTIQVNLDYESEQDMVEKFRIGLALQPIASALFANSPFKEGKPTEYVSWRGHVWSDVDPARSGNLPFVFEDGFGFERYAQYAMDVPMYFVYRKEHGYVNALGQSWRDFMEGKLPALPGEYPTIQDWENHLSTAFPEVRLKKFLEMRGADGGPWKMICALPALWVGLLYDRQAQSEALDLIEGWSQADRDYLQEEVCKQGLRTPFKDGTVLDIAKKVVACSQGGLSRRGFEEVAFLDKLQDVIDRGQSPSDDLLDLYNSTWNGSVEPVYNELLY